MSNLIKKYTQFINERYDVNNLPNNIVVLSKGLSKNYGKFLLFNTKTKKSIGYIDFSLDKHIKSFTVGGAYSEKGYGAFLYETALTYVYPNALSMSRDSTTSEDALNVWFKFNERNDVKKERIETKKITHKKRDWLDSGYLDDDPEYRQRIFDLEDTKFYYTFGKEKLNELIQLGEDYMKDNNISEKDVEHMSWDLEK